MSLAVDALSISIQHLKISITRRFDDVMEVRMQIQRAISEGINASKALLNLKRSTGAQIYEEDFFVDPGLDVLSDYLKRLSRTLFNQMMQMRSVVGPLMRVNKDLRQVFIQ